MTLLLAADTSTRDAPDMPHLLATRHLPDKSPCLKRLRSIPVAQDSASCAPITRIGLLHNTALKAQQSFTSRPAKALPRKASIFEGNYSDRHEPNEVPNVVPQNVKPKLNVQDAVARHTSITIFR